MKRNSQYALYKGEKLVGIGTKKELAEIMSFETGTEITKSGLNHRFRKIREILDNIENK